LLKAGEGLLEELKAVRDLSSGVDVERGAVILSERGQADAVAEEGAVAVDEGTGRGWRCGGLLLQNEGLSPWCGCLTRGVRDERRSLRLRWASLRMTQFEGTAQRVNWRRYLRCAYG
jgi:hypothetical protein